jgi:hypothetical protein
MGNAEKKNVELPPAEIEEPIEERCDEIIPSNGEMDPAILIDEVDEEMSCEEVERLLENKQSNSEEAAEEEDVFRDESAEDTVDEEPEQESEEKEESAEEVEPNDEEAIYEEENSEDVRNEKEEDSNSIENEEVERTEEEGIDGDQEEKEDQEENEDDEINRTYLQSVEREVIAPMQSPGLIDARLLTDTGLEANHRQKSDGTHEITLTYEGYGALQLGLLSNTHINFILPREIADVISADNLTATYDVPRLSLLFPILRNTGTFDNEDININENIVHMDFFNLIALNILSYTNYNFELIIELDDLPATSTGEYVFYAEATNQLVDADIITGGDSAYATLPAPRPIYSFHSVPENIAFQTTEINPGVVRIPRKDPDWAIEVMDTRVQGSPIRILAEEKNPLQTRDGTHSLPDALVYVDGNGESKRLSEGAVQVYSGESGSESVTEISWAPDEGILVETDPANAYASDYRGTITWTLVDAP